MGSSMDCSISSFSVVCSTDCRKLLALVHGEPPPVSSSLPLVFTGLFFTISPIQTLLCRVMPLPSFREAPPVSLTAVLCPAVELARSRQHLTFSERGYLCSHQPHHQNSSSKHNARILPIIQNIYGPRKDTILDNSTINHNL